MTNYNTSNIPIPSQLLNFQVLSGKLFFPVNFLLNSENNLKRLFLYGAWVRTSILHTLLQFEKANAHSFVKIIIFYNINIIRPSSERTQLYQTVPGAGVL